jgi:hypothetical protein
MRAKLRNLLVLWPIAYLIGCSASPKTRADSATTTPSNVPRATARPTQKVGAKPMVVNGPVVVAFFATTQAEIDANPDQGEALSDFQFYLEGMRKALDSLGVALIEQYTDTVSFTVNGRKTTWVPQKDSASVGYLFLSPRRAPNAKFGVMTNTDLLETVREWLTQLH